MEIDVILMNSGPTANYQNSPRPVLEVLRRASKFVGIIEMPVKRQFPASRAR